MTDPDADLLPAAPPPRRIPYFQIAPLVLTVPLLALPLFVPASHRAGLFPPLVAIVTLAAACTLLYHIRRHWHRPTRELHRLLHAIAENRAPITELESIYPGGLRTVLPLVTQLLRDLRQQKAELAKLDVEMSQRIANRTQAIERSLSTFKNQAERDGLTGLYNRRAFDNTFPKILDSCRNANSNCFVLMIDLDRFKSVNDTLGHAAGDALLSDVGDLIRSNIRTTDFAFRYGGDEFVILLPGATPTIARACAQRLTDLGAALGRTLKLPLPPGLTVGSASLHDLPNGTPPELLHAADADLYSKKPSRRRSA